MLSACVARLLRQGRAQCPQCRVDVEFCVDGRTARLTPKRKRWRIGGCGCQSGGCPRRTASRAMLPDPPRGCSKSARSMWKASSAWNQFVREVGESTRRSRGTPPGTPRHTPPPPATPRHPPAPPARQPPAPRAPPGTPGTAGTPRHRRYSLFVGSSTTSRTLKYHFVLDNGYDLETLDAYSTPVREGRQARLVPVHTGLDDTSGNLVC